MAQCPKDGTEVNLSSPSTPKNCSCPVCGAWVYPHLLLTAGKVSLEFDHDTTFGQADVRRLGGSESLSRTHARFYPTEEGWNLVSLSVRNASAVNGKPIEQLQTVPLHDGDEVMLGSISFLIGIKQPPT